MTNNSTNKHIVEEFISALFSNGDLTAVDRHLDPRLISHDPPLWGVPEGPEGWRTAAEVIRRAFPDWRSDIQHMIAEDDLVAEHFLAHGTHRGSVMGETPTGQHVVMPGINIFRITNGKIVERWGQLNQLGLLQQLGLLPNRSVRRAARYAAITSAPWPSADKSAHRGSITSLSEQQATSGGSVRRTV